MTAPDVLLLDGRLPRVAEERVGPEVVAGQCPDPRVTHGCSTLPTPPTPGAYRSTVSSDRQYYRAESCVTREG